MSAAQSFGWHAMLWVGLMLGTFSYMAMTGTFNAATLIDRSWWQAVALLAAWFANQFVWSAS